MNYGLLLVSFLIGCLVCLPIFKMFLNAALKNQPEFEKGYTKELNSDANEDFVRGKLGGYAVRDAGDSVVDRLTVTKIVMLLIPLLPACVIALPVYLGLQWLL
ncbi:MAG: hypothetical protein VXZ36_12960 [Pseudomonadota bacterium]|nr:hypothetical protein [Pseudomonadota bacterium]